MLYLAKIRRRVCWHLANRPRIDNLCLNLNLGRFISSDGGSLTHVVKCRDRQRPTCVVKDGHVKQHETIIWKNFNGDW